MTQEEALTILKTGANVFLTGEPGSGKTYTVNSFVKYLHENDVDVAITASTGIAATHIGGVTIHSWSGIGIKEQLTKYDLDRISSSEPIAKRVGHARVLIIDEVSMLSPETLGMVDMVCRAVKGYDEPFGGLQVVLVGDFFQLPPVQKGYRAPEQGLLGGGRPPQFCYDAPVWSSAQFIICYLTEQFRSDDSALTDVLTALRGNTFDEMHFELIESRKYEASKVPKDIPKLYTHNAAVDTMNDTHLAAIKGESQTYLMKSFGSKPLIEGLKKGCLSPQKLVLKIGARVMCTKNNPRGNIVNGTLGVVVGYTDFDKYPIIETQEGVRVTIEPEDWVVEDNGKVRASITQIPLRLAWAITVHKSQGMSLDAAVMDLSNVFEYGQGYVALSRVRTLDGLHLLGWNRRTFEVHPHVLQRDEEFRVQSHAAQDSFNDMPASEVSEMHAQYLKRFSGD